MKTKESVIARGLLARFNSAGLIGQAAVHASRSIELLYGESDELVLLAASLCVQAAQLGSACLPMESKDSLRDLLLSEEELSDPERLDLLAELDWPDFSSWRAVLCSSKIVSTSQEDAPNRLPLRFIDSNLYLESNWLYQSDVVDDLIEKIKTPPPEVDEAALEKELEEIFDGAEKPEPLRSALVNQRNAVRNCISSWISVIAGGPGTGKTHTLAALLSALSASSPTKLHVALTSFSGKAAARMNESLAQNVLSAGLANIRIDRGVTLHKLLGSRGTLNGFTYDATNRLPHDVVIVDEVSMLSLPMMKRLLSALRSNTRLILIGDPDQLTSIDVGTVLADIVDADVPGNKFNEIPLVSRLEINLRSSGNIPELAERIRLGDFDGAIEILNKNEGGIEYIDTDASEISFSTNESAASDVLVSARQMLKCANSGLVSEALQALDSHRLLCAHANGIYGASNWQATIDAFLRTQLTGWSSTEEIYPGMPLIITSNSPDLGIFNGDTGVVVLKDGTLQAAIGSKEDFKLIPPSMLDSYQLVHAMTVHKSQGSQYGKVTLILPSHESPILTRELLYTAVTRAKKAIRIIGTQQAVAAAIENPARRASGLTNRLLAFKPSL